MDLAPNFCGRSKAKEIRDAFGQWFQQPHPGFSSIVCFEDKCLDFDTSKPAGQRIVGKDTQPSSGLSRVRLFAQAVGIEERVSPPCGCVMPGQLSNLVNED